MSKLLACTISVLLGAAQAAEVDVEQLVHDALLALPDDLRTDATVVKFENGEQIVLREGANDIICRADDPDLPGIAIWCYPRSHDAYARRWYELAAQEKQRDVVNEIIESEIKSGELEWPDVAVNYNLRGGSLDTAVPTTVVYVPFATGNALGITEERRFRAPWLMLAGTAFAHIMIPGQ